METRIFHGGLTPNDLAQALIGEFNRGSFRAQQLGNDQQMIVQIVTSEYAQSGGHTAITVTIRKVVDGISIQIGNQALLGVAASLGQTALSAIRNPWGLLGRLDDLAQDIESIKLSDQVWHVIETTALAAGASFELSERLRRMVCAYCNVANPVGEASCIACGAPLGNVQPRTCLNCGFVVKSGETICPNCGQRIPS
jgi:hypothetical protein